MFSGGPRCRRRSPPPKLSSNRAAFSSVQLVGSGVGGVGGVCETLGAGSPTGLGAGSVQNIVRTPPDSPMMTAGAPRHCWVELRAPFGSSGCGGKWPPMSSGLTPLMQAAGGHVLGESACGSGAGARGRYGSGGSGGELSSFTGEGCGVGTCCLCSDLIVTGAPSNLITE